MQDWEFTLRRVTHLGAQTYVGEFGVPSAFSAYPGQFVSVSVPTRDGQERSFYTVSSAFAEDQISIAFESGADSEVGRRLVDAEPGSQVSVTGPAGETYYEGGSDVAVLAGGPGIGAALGIGERALATGHAATIVYADETPVGQGRLTALSAAGADVHVTKDGLQGPTTRAVDAIDGSVFVYGFDPFVDRAQRALAGAGVDPERVQISSYG